jgi:formylglycine-generating enzyme required for sulfatase activity
MDTTEVTQEQYASVVKYNPSTYNDPRLPVESVTWFDAIRYCNLLSKQEGFDTIYRYDQIRAENAVNLECHWEKSGYRLPTNDEWELAFRADSATLYFWGDDTSDNSAKKYAWFGKSADSAQWTNPHAQLVGPQPVATLLPSAWQLYDMAGNLYEWCWDWNTSEASKPNPRIDYKGANICELCAGRYMRIVRGGYWMGSKNELQLTSTAASPVERRSNNIGFRTVLTIQ